MCKFSPFGFAFLIFGPRLGFSWQPTKHVVFHGGAGIYYGPSVQMVGNTGLNSDGFSTSTTWNATQWNNDPNTINYDCETLNGTPPPCGSQGNTVILKPASATPVCSILFAECVEAAKLLSVRR